MEKRHKIHFEFTPNPLCFKGSLTHGLKRIQDMEVHREVNGKVNSGVNLEVDSVANSK